MQTAFHEKYASDGLQVIALDPDPADALDVEGVAAWAGAIGLTMPVVIETSETYELFAATYFAGSPFPIDVVVDRNGIVRYIAPEYDPLALDEIIRELLSE